MTRKTMEYGSEYDWLANEDFLRDYDTGFVKSDWQLYRSGRDALKAFACIAGRKKVLVPALCCESMISPFELNGYKVEFYKLEKELCADTADVLQKLEPGCVLLYMRYFGIPAFSDSFLESLKARDEDILLVEDRTHDILLKRGEEAFRPDAMLSSLRKWAALPDGGMLTTELGCCDAVDDSRFADIRLEAMQKKSRYLESWEPELKKEFLNELGCASDILDEGPIPAAMGEKEEQLLRRLDMEQLLRRRQENALLLKELLSPLAVAGKLEFMTKSPENSTLYFPLFLEQRRAVQLAMAQHDIYCPVIWPMPEQAEGICPVSRYVTEHMLAIPCDQRYCAEDMRFIAGTLSKILNGENDNG